MLHKPLCLSTVEGVTVEPPAAFAQLQLGFVDQTQWRYEVIRPLVLFADRTAAQRAQETDTHPDTVRALQRRFRQQGMQGLLPADVEVVHRRRLGEQHGAVPHVRDLTAVFNGMIRTLAKARVCGKRNGCGSPSVNRW